MNNLLKLNLGCGQNLLEGYINVDKFGEPDVRHDLETFPWPWHDNSVQLMVLNHCLEHLGAETSVYLNIFKEMYRIGAPDARIHIAVPHPRHDDFINDPTHVRAITADSLKLFSKKLNKKWQEENCANSPLGLFLDVDFDVVKYKYTFDPEWQSKFQEGLCTESALYNAIKKYNNVIREIQIVMQVNK